MTTVKHGVAVRFGKIGLWCWNGIGHGLSVSLLTEDGTWSSAYSTNWNLITNSSQDTTGNTSQKGVPIDTARTSTLCHENAPVNNVVLRFSHLPLINAVRAVACSQSRHPEESCRSWGHGSSQRGRYGYHQGNNPALGRTYAYV
jgi:hypothetical protein